MHIVAGGVGQWETWELIMYLRANERPWNEYNGKWKNKQTCQQIEQKSTALPWVLSKYLTAQDTHVTPTLTKHNRILVRLGNLLSLQPYSTIQLKDLFSVPSIKLNHHKIDIALSCQQQQKILNLIFFFINGNKLYTSAFVANSVIIFYLKYTLYVLNVTFHYINCIGFQTIY